LNSLSFNDPLTTLDSEIETSYMPPIDAVYYPYKYATQHDVVNECAMLTAVGDNVNGVYYEDPILTPPYGTSLEQLTLLINCQFSSSEGGEEAVPKATFTHVDPSNVSLDAFRALIIDALSSTSSASTSSGGSDSGAGRVLVNFARAEIPRMHGGGHWSPVAAYAPDADAFLVLDVAKYKYPPFWASAEALWRAAGTVDSCGVW
jgi:hypothetical protein